MSQLSDQRLLDQIKNGDQKAFKGIFDQYYNELFRFSLSMVRSEMICEEIVQDAFVYLWEKSGKIKITTSIKSYLYTTIKNKSINYIKNELPKQQLSESLTSEMLFKTEEVAEERNLKIRIQHAIDQLPTKCKQIFILSRYSGYTYREISEELDISIKTVENQMSIALQKLRILLPKKNE